MSELRALLLRLCVAMEAQTEAISALAASNEAIVDELAAQAGGDQEDEEGHGLDMSGKPIKAS